jgi:flagella basal body P-ring formation protein FlgA
MNTSPRPVWLLIAGLAFAPCALAQQDPAAVHASVLAFLERETQGLPGEVQISVAPFDARNQLPPCAALAPFLPAGTRAWGQVNVGVRCDSPVTWTAYAQAQVKVFGSYLVATRPLRSAQIVGHADIDLRKGELTALPDNVLNDPVQAVGHHTRFAVAAGAPLRATMLRMPDAVRQGREVQVVGIGKGFRVSTEGRALNSAAPGESVRVRLPDGQVATGTARADGSVELAF